MISGVFNSFASVTIIRILSRVLQFILRVYLIREVLSPQILAEMVALDLILTTALHITKSCFKLSYQQVQSKSKAHNVVSSMNLMSVGVLTTAISAAVVIFLQWHHKIMVLYVNHTILMYGVCSIVEAIRQKYSVEFVLGYQYKKLAIIEFIGYLPKTFVIFVAAKLGLFQTYGILVFGVGQLVYYGICLLITFWLTSYKVLFITPFQTESKEGVEERAYFDSKTKKILKELSYISLLKLFLQQFEKIVLVYQNTVQDSSIYSLVSNLGSIIVRFVFAPLEEIAYNYYARGTELESKTTLITLIKIILLFSVMCIGFGFRYAGNVLHLLYGEKWVSSESVLGFQCFMILVGIMGLNGTIDAFVMARADAVHTIPQLKYYTIISTGVYFGSSFVLLHYGLGAAGLFLGNSLGMLTKIIINWKIEVSKHIRMSEFLAKISPSPLFLFILFTSIFSSYQIRTRLNQLTPLVDFMVGVLLFGVCLLPLLYEYRTQLIGLIRQKILNKKAKNRKFTQLSLPPTHQAKVCYAQYLFLFGARRVHSRPASTYRENEKISLIFCSILGGPQCQLGNTRHSQRHFTLDWDHFLFKAPSIWLIFIPAPRFLSIQRQTQQFWPPNYHPSQMRNLTFHSDIAQVRPHTPSFFQYSIQACLPQCIQCFHISRCCYSINFLFSHSFQLVFCFLLSSSCILLLSPKTVLSVSYFLSPNYGRYFGVSIQFTIAFCQSLRSSSVLRINQDFLKLRIILVIKLLL